MTHFLASLVAMWANLTMLTSTITPIIPQPACTQSGQIRTVFFIEILQYLNLIHLCWYTLSISWKYCKMPPHNPEVVGSSPSPATNIANRKRYRFEKPRNHNGFGVLLCHFLRWNLKDIIPQNRPLGRTWTKILELFTFFVNPLCFLPKYVII